MQVEQILTLNCLEHTLAVQLQSFGNVVLRFDLENHLVNQLLLRLLFALAALDVGLPELQV